jgi:hypothetical protein
MLCNSWVIVRRDTGKPVFETWSPEIAAAINREAYDVLTAHAWLVRLNQSIKSEG